MEKTTVPIYKFQLDCLPPSVNVVWKRSSRGMFKNERAREFEEVAGYQLKKLKTPIKAKVGIRLIFTFKSEKRCNQRDLDNCLKLVFDLLASNGILENDNQIVHLHAWKIHADKDGVIGEIVDAADIRE